MKAKVCKAVLVCQVPEALAELGRVYRSSVIVTKYQVKVLILVP